MSNGDNSHRGTSPDEGGASTAPHVPRCRISITSTKAALHFASSGKGSEVFRATLSRERPGHSVRWELSPADDKDTGTVRFADASSIETVVWARHPNRATVRVSYRRPWGTVLCEDSRAISVPQYFWLRYRTSEPTSGFLLDLERLGLRRRPPLSTAQADTNARVLAAVKMEVMATAWRAFDGVNVRFVESDPSAVVLRANVTTVDIGGVDLGDTRTGWTEPPVTKFDPDLGNLDPRQSIFVQSGWFTAVKSDRIVPKSGLYKRIFGPLAVENHKGEELDGKAVDADDFPPKPTTPRQRTVHAAVTAFGRLLGSVVAHECGHALGLDHNFVPGRPKTEVNEIPWSRLMGVSTNELMDGGKFATFHDYTGITGFDPKSGKAVVGQPIAFAPYKLRALRKLLPVFIMGPPGPDELRR